MRVAFVDHSFHQRTQSSRFLLEALEAGWDVELILDHSWDPTAAADTSPFDPSGYDAIVIFQVRDFFHRLTTPHPNITFIPMYDAMVWRGQFYWHPRFAQAKVLSFCWKLHEQVARYTPHGLHVQYYPEPGEARPPAEGGGLRGFFWYRMQDIGTDTVFDLCRNHVFERFTVHNVPDPSHGGGTGGRVPAHIRDLVLSDWFPTKGDYLDTLRQHNVFFAPRPLEGIGMSVLEAMALGQCVVAPDAPTMNEYIANGTTGLLYPLPARGRPAPLDFSRAREIGLRARDSVVRGRDRWLAGLPGLLDFIATPMDRLERTSFGRRSVRLTTDAAPAAPAMTIPSPPSSLATTPPPVVSVVITNPGVGPESSLPGPDATLRSVLGQRGLAFEVVAPEGGTPGGVPDDGDYAAMNRALARCRGDWVLFLRAGDTLADDQALCRMFAAVPADADIVYGHHLSRSAEDIDRFRPAAEFETAWCRLQRGELGDGWLARLPARQATAARRSLLVRLRFDPRYRATGDHELLFRARRERARFFHCDELIAVCRAAGPPRESCGAFVLEWAAIARAHGNAAGAARFFAERMVRNCAAVRGLRAFGVQGLGVLGRIHPGLRARAELGVGHPLVRHAARCAVMLAGRLVQPLLARAAGRFPA